jgi:Methylase involved in ubiquinone/menaquinone biosynthesis
MKKYLSKRLDWRRSEIANQYDELPLWSSPFGLLLLDNFPIGEYENYLDIGSGTGFPLIEIAQRLGSNCKAVGIDPWKAAVNRAKFKIETLELSYIELIESDASTIPYPDNYFDLITSNLGINNFRNPLQTLMECYRVIKPNKSLCLTTNLIGTFSEFYDIFFQTLEELHLPEYADELQKHIKQRGTIELKIDLINQAGFKLVKQVESEYKMRYLNGTTFLNHSMTLIAFIDSWRNMFTDSEKTLVFDLLENRLNEYSKKKGYLELTIPMLYLECRK